MTSASATAEISALGKWVRSGRQNLRDQGDHGFRYASSDALVTKDFLSTRSTVQVVEKMDNGLTLLEYLPKRLQGEIGFAREVPARMMMMWCGPSKQKDLLQKDHF